MFNCCEAVCKTKLRSKEIPAYTNFWWINKLTVLWNLCSTVVKQLAKQNYVPKKFQPTLNFW
jgi:hypothetical protein